MKRTPPRALHHSKKDKKKLTEEEQREGKELADYQGETRPKTRADCANVPRPCPYVSCRYHLYLTVRRSKKSDSIWVNFPQIEGPDELEFSCALDEADAVQGYGMTLEELSKRLNVTRERARQLEVEVLRKIRTRATRDPTCRILTDLFDAIAERPRPDTLG